MEDFKSKIESKYIDMMGLAKHLGIQEIEYSTATATINWRCEPEYKCDGIYGFFTIIDKVSIEIEYEYYKDGQSDDDEDLTTDSITISGELFTIIDKLKVSESGQLIISEVEIYFPEKRITII